MVEGLLFLLGVVLVVAAFRMALRQSRPSERWPWDDRPSKVNPGQLLVLREPAGGFERGTLVRVIQGELDQDRSTCIIEPMVGSSTGLPDFEPSGVQLTVPRESLARSLAQGRLW